MGYGDLSKRQLEILEGIANGKSDSELSKKLGITPSTIRSHLEVICDELGINEEGKRGTYRRIKASVEYWKNNLEKLSKP